jgi:ABC-2 type transport system permease protein
VIITIFQIALLRLWNNKQELLLAFVVPILFFSIFAVIFGRGVGSGSAAIKVAIVDDDRTPLTAEVIRQLKEQPSMEIVVGILYKDAQWSLEKLTRAVFRETDTDIVICLPFGMERSLAAQTPVTLRLLSEGTNPVGRQIVTMILSQVVTVAAAKTPPRNPIPSLTQQPSSTVARHLLPADTGSEAQHLVRPNPTAPATVRDLVTFETTDIFAANKQNPKIAMYAAGIAVMFLLFSATGAGGSLLEEYEAGTLDRLLTSRLTVTQLLAGKWLYITCLGCVQLTIMFLWAQLAFGVDLAGHIPGFAVMTLCTAGATASFALTLAVVCRSRSQLNGVSIVLILTMSALGGSMVPRYIMSAEMQRWGQMTFNAWALDGFQKVFWFDLPVAALATEIKVLFTMTVALAAIARSFADRWES